MLDLEKALNRREVLGVKGRATQASSKGGWALGFHPEP